MKLWGGRFAEPTAKDVEDFSRSIETDSRLWEVDIRGSIAHARMLGTIGVLSATETESVLKALQSLHEDLKTGKQTLDPQAEDIHSEIEKKLTQSIGSLAGKIHTARSRNDQVATDTRLYLAGEVVQIQMELQDLQKYFLSTAEKHQNSIMPGLTHMQHAQPVSLGHHLLAYFWMFDRDRERLQQLQSRILALPLGAGALAGTSFPLERQQVATELGFQSVIANSLDAVSDRDYIVEFLSAASISMMHLSKISEELILWSMPEFAFVQMSDQVTTGSSMMPQKKNPDVAELIRGRVGRVYGSLMASLTMLKALPLAYNRDLQEDKIHLFEGLDTWRSCLRLMRLMLQQTTWKTENMKSALKGDFSNATDLADDLVEKGVPFREAHDVVGQVVQYCLKEGKILESLTLPELQKFSSKFNSDTLRVLPHQAVMERRHSPGGTSPQALQAQIQAAQIRI